jgi:tetratricopeptide (TPR) repeat protein
MDIKAFAAETGIDAENIPGLLSELAISAYERYMQTGSRDDISEAIDRAKQGIYRAKDNNPLLTQWLNNLGAFLESRYERTGEINDLQEAIQIARQAAESTPDDHPDMPARLYNLGNKLGRRYERTGEIRDLEEAIKTARQGIELAPNDHPDQPARLYNLRNKLGRRYEWTAEMKDLEEASTYLLEAWSCLNAVLFHCVTAAAICLKLLTKQNRVAQSIDLRRSILDLLPLVYIRALDRND